MIFKIRIAHWRFTFTIAPVTDIIGVNSNIDKRNHIIMWDFDEQNMYAVLYNLALVQHEFNLPRIRVLTTGKPLHFIAYCFYKVPWWMSKRIVASTHGVDPNFFKYGVYRDHWTLRVTPKEGRKPQLIYTLDSPYKEDCSIDELNSWTLYETLADHAPMKKVELNFIGNK